MTVDEGEANNGEEGVAASTLLERAREEIKVKDAELERRGVDLEVAAKSGLALVWENNELKDRVERLTESLQRTRRGALHPRPLANAELSGRGSDADVSDYSDTSDGGAAKGAAVWRAGALGSPRTPAAGGPPSAPAEGHRRNRGLTTRPPCPTWGSPARCADRDYIRSLELERDELQSNLETVVSESEKAQRLARHTQKRLEAELEKTLADLDAALRDKDELELDKKMLARQHAEIAANYRFALSTLAAAEVGSVNEEPRGSSAAHGSLTAQYAARSGQALRRLSERVAELEMSVQSLKSAKADAERRLRSTLLDLEASRRRVEDLVAVEAEMPALRRAWEQQQDEIRELCEELREERMRNAHLERLVGLETSPAITGGTSHSEPDTPQPRRRSGPRQSRDSDNDGLFVDVPANFTTQPAAAAASLATPTNRLRRTARRSLQAEIESALENGGAAFSLRRGEDDRVDHLALLTSGSGASPGAADEYPFDNNGVPPFATGVSIGQGPVLVGFLRRRIRAIIRYVKFLVILFCSVLHALWVGPEFGSGASPGAVDEHPFDHNGDPPLATGISISQGPAPVGFLCRRICATIRYVKFLVVLLCSVLYALWVGPESG